MTSTLYYYPFNNNDRMSNDVADNTIQTSSNNEYVNYMLSGASDTELATSGSYVDFAVGQPSILFSGTVHGNGLNGSVIDSDSLLTIKKKNDRPLEKLQLNQRPFLTVPYLGRGQVNPSLESQLQQGEIASDKKSVSTIMEKSFMEYSMYPVDDKMKQRVDNPSKNVEEYALEGWVRGGVSSREMK
jgi:hypothetical protein